MLRWSIVWSANIFVFFSLLIWKSKHYNFSIFDADVKHDHQDDGLVFFLTRLQQVKKLVLVLVSFVACRNMAASRCSNSAGWSRSYCDGGGGCSGGWSSSCGGGGGCCGRWRRWRGGGPWKTRAAARRPRLPSELRCIGWNRTSWKCPPEECWRRTDVHYWLR